jgi:hypothetical protein
MWRIAADVHLLAPELITYEARGRVHGVYSSDCRDINRLQHGISHARIKGQEGATDRAGAIRIEHGEPDKRPAHAVPKIDI